MSSSLKSEAVALYAMYALKHATTLALLPYLARVLGAEAWGVLGFAYGLAAYLIVGMEYGFALSATREVALHREERERLKRIVNGVIGAKAALALGLTVVAVLAYGWVPTGLQDPWIWSGAICFAIAMAFDWNWYFLGVGQVRRMVGIELVGRLAALAAILLWVTGPEHVARVLYLQAGGGGLALILGAVWVVRSVGWPRLEGGAVAEALRQGWSLFAFQGLSKIYTAGNAFLLGWLVAPAAIGVYIGAERIVRMAGALHQPMSQLLYPRRVRSGAVQRLPVGRVLMAYVAAGSLASLVLGLGAPLVIGLVLGPGYEAAVPVLRVLALVPVLVAASQALGVQWMLPTRQDGPFLRIIAAAGALNLVLVLMAVPLWGVLAAAWAVVAVEAFVVSCMLVRYVRARPTPVAPPSHSNAICP